MVNLENKEKLILHYAKGLQCIISKTSKWIVPLCIFYILFHLMFFSFLKFSVGSVSPTRCILFYSVGCYLFQLSPPTFLVQKSFTVFNYCQHSISSFLEVLLVVLCSRELLCSCVFLRCYLSCTKYSCINIFLFVLDPQK